MTPRSVETAVARFTLVLLLVYVPAGDVGLLAVRLTNPFYLVDVVGFALLLWGALASLRRPTRRRPRRALRRIRVEWGERLAGPGAPHADPGAGRSGRCHARLAARRLREVVALTGLALLLLLVVESRTPGRAEHRPD